MEIMGTIKRRLLSSSRDSDRTACLSICLHGWKELTDGWKKLTPSLISLVRDFQFEAKLYNLSLAFIGVFFVRLGL